MLSTEFELVKGFPVGAVWETQGFDSWVGKILWSRKWQPSLVFLPGEFHGQKHLASPWNHKQSDMTEPLTTVGPPRNLLNPNSLIEENSKKNL